MFKKSIKLFRLFGFEVKLDLSWLIVAALITWTLSADYFPHQFKDLPLSSYWLMGILGALGLFLSIVLHEFAHSLVARSYGIPMKGITLFIFGGVAEMNEEPSSPKSEFFMAVVGPISSFFISGVFYGAYFLGNKFNLPVAINGVTQYLAFINVALAIFNLIPAFPLDGGRMLRSVLWGIKDNIKWATRISTRIGSGFGIFLIILGILQVFGGNLVGGIWMALIGTFIQGAAKMSYQQLLLRRALEGEPVKRFMNENPVTVPPSITIQQLVEDYIYKYHFKMFPVIEDDNLVGCITTREVKEIPRDQWKEKTVGEVASKCSSENTIRYDADSVEALSKMKKTESSRLMVVENGHLRGIISLKDLLSFLSLKIELEEE